VRAYTRKYSYDKIGNIQQMRQTGSNAFTRNFHYFDETNQLREVTTGSSATIESFSYDNVGNQITAGSTRHYQWDAANQLLIYKNQASGSDPSIYAQYQYAGGSRVSKMVRTGTDVAPIYERTIYIDGIFEYLKLENGTTYEKNYVQIMDDKSRICEVRVGTPFPDDIADATTYILEDQIGSSVARLDTSGGFIDIEEYYPFGDSSLRTFSKKRYRYVGKEKDLESGLYYYGARYYAAWTCRFISVDPLKEKRAWLAPYNYVQNNPIKNTDPTGALDDGGGGSGGGTQGSGSAQQGGNAQSNAQNQTTTQTQVHSVQKGDTISGLAEQYGVSQDAIRQANPQTQSRSQSDQINVGEKLKIPGGSTSGNISSSSKLSSSSKINEIGKQLDSLGLLADAPPQNQGNIHKTEGLAALEMWLESPSAGATEFVSKVALNIVYGVVNSPYTFFMDETIAGSPANSAQQMDAFVDFAPGALLKGVGSLDDMVKVTGKGLEGYNQFVKKSGKAATTSSGLPSGMSWQTRAGQLYRTNTENLKAVEGAKEALEIQSKTSLMMKQQ